MGDTPTSKFIKHPDTPEGRLKRRTSELERVGLVSLDDKGKVRQVASTIAQRCEDRLASFGLNLLLTGLENVSLTSESRSVEDLSRENVQLKAELRVAQVEVAALRERVVQFEYSVTDLELTQLADCLKGSFCAHG